MGLVGINSTHAPTNTSKDVLDQIAQGVGIATNLLGATGKAYEVFGAPGQAETANKNAQSRYYDAHAGYMKALTETAPIVAAAKASGASQKNNVHQDQMFVKANADFEALRGNKALQNAQELVRLGNNVKSIAEQAPMKGDGTRDYDALATGQKSLMDSELAKIATGSVAAQEALHEIQDPTLQSAYAKLMAKIKNEPQGAMQGAFISQKLRYVDDLVSNSQKLMQDTFERKMKVWESKLSKDDADNIKGAWSNYIHNAGKTAIEAAPTPAPNVAPGVIPSMGGGMAKPLIIRQGNHIYNLNPQTGEYE